LAFVLPGAFLFANYAERVRHAIRQHFERVQIIRLALDTFAASGADERGVIVLAEGYRETPRKGTAWQIKVAKALEELGNIDALAAAPHCAAVDLHRLFPGIAFEPLTKRATVSIGLVTGANRFFIIGEQTRETFSLPQEALFPIVSRAAHSTGLTFGMRDHAVALRSGSKCWLFSPSELGPRNGPVRAYLATIPPAVRIGTVWFRKRDNWFQPELDRAPHAILTYMNHDAPRLVLLENGIRATNTLHAVTFAPKLKTWQRQAVALGLLTSTARLSAELEGRWYGRGLLKLEPSGARKIVLPSILQLERTAVIDAFARADRSMRAGRRSDACEIADQIFFGRLHERGLSAVYDALLACRRIRLPSDD
jgi:adenine-specific DNA-methyltransferase